MNDAIHSQQKPCETATPCGLCFNNLVDHANKFVLMLTPKSGSQSLVEVYRRGTWRSPKFMSREFVEWRCRDYLKIAFVRNPWARLVSCWQDKTIRSYYRTWPNYGISPGESFEAFVRTVIKVPAPSSDKHWRSMAYDLTDNRGNCIPEYVAKCETLAYDWDVARGIIAGRRGLQLPAVPHMNKTDHKHYSTYYDDELAELVGEYYAQDIKLFDYGFERCS